MNITKLFITTTFAAITTQASPISGLVGKSQVCFKTSYSEAHMRSHPAQTVKEMTVKLQLEPEVYQETILMGVSAKIPSKSSRKTYRNVMACHLDEQQTSLKCSIDCDGGSAEVKWDINNTADDKIQLVNKGFVLYGGCGSDVDFKDFVWLTPKKGGDDVFNLTKIDDATCKKLPSNIDFGGN